MDTFSAFAKGEANRGKPLMVFDWNKAARLIKEHGAKYAAAGLRSDWEWTGGAIYQDGEIITDSYTYLASTWAVPELEIDGEIYECFIMESDSPGWRSDTKWPNSARKLLNLMK